ncbi:MAG: hypothetical protein LBN04_05790 [Oscillospiraceae bacterium]|nr:hypothetical protein [Oscillospiraceae bacterium]
MKKVGWMMLVGLLALCVFGGAAVADAYEIEELGLTFELPDGWIAVTEGDAAYSAINRMEETIKDSFAPADMMFHFAAVSPDAPTAGIFWAEMAQAVLPTVASYRWAPDEFLSLHLQNAPNSTLARGKDSVFFVQTSHDFANTAIIAITQEQYKTIVCVGTGFWWGDVALSTAMDTVLASAAFTPPTTPVDLQTIVRDPVTWHEAFISLLAEYADGAVLSPLPSVVREDGSYSIALYHTQHTTIHLIGDTPDVIREISIVSRPLAGVPINHVHESDLSEAEADFLSLAALAMAASLRQHSTQTDLSKNVALVHNAMQNIAAIDQEGSHFQFFSWYGLKLAVVYGPFDEDPLLNVVLYF